MVKTTRKTSTPRPVGSPEISPQKGIELIRRQIAAGEELLKNRPLTDNAFAAWKMLTRNFLEKCFGAKSTNVHSVTTAGNCGSFPMNAGEDWWENHRVETLHTQLTRMQSLIELLTTEIELQGGTPDSPTQVTLTSHRIFLVHGHEEAALHETARFLEKLEQEVIVLREQPNKGRTIIQKFEDYADVGFAVVLLTGDDIGGSAKDTVQKPRARQNVIFEMGYFIGRLGRDRVCVLYSPGVEIPSDYTGVLYQELDSKGSWRLELARELKAAGYEIDMNKAL
jgi:predicted nucleotide-binding protein